MEETDKDRMIRMVGGWMFLLVLAHPGSPRQRAVKRSLLCCCFVLTIACYTTYYLCRHGTNSTQILSGMTNAGCLPIHRVIVT